MSKDEGVWETLGEMKIPRSGHTCATITPPEGDRLLVMGGMSADGKPVPEAELFDPVSQKWTIDKEHAVPYPTKW